MDTPQEYQIDLVEPLEYDSRPTGESMANPPKVDPPKRDWAGIFAGCIFVGGLLWGAHIEISKVDDRIASVDKHIGQMGRNGPFQYLKDSLISGPNAIAMGTEKGFVLDGFYLDNVVFQNANIIYHGGPVILQSVRFVNCTFDVRRSSQSEKF